MLAAGPGQSFTERHTAASAALAAKYPEVREAMQRSGIPTDVNDAKLAEQILKEYRQLMIPDPGQRTAPLAQWLQAQGYAAKTIARLPALTAVLPKRIIEALAQRGDVGTIFLERTVEAISSVHTMPASIITMRSSRPTTKSSCHKRVSIRYASVLQDFQLA